MSSNTLIIGEPGTGKSNACCGWDESILYLNLEDGKEDKNNRLEALITAYYPDKFIERVHLCTLFPKDIMVGKIKRKAYQIDGIASLKAFNEQIDKLLSSKSCEYLTAIVDGITPLRDFAHDQWCLENSRLHAVNPGDWSDVNDIVRDKLQPLTTWGKRNGVNIVLTAQMKDDYQKVVKNDKGKKIEESVKVGRIGNFKEWQTYGVNTIIELISEKDVLKKPTGKYFAVCEKSIKGSWTEEITGLNLFDVLQERGIQ